MRKLIRWTKDETECVVRDYADYERGELAESELTSAYGGRTVAAIREKARILRLRTDKPMEKKRKNPVYSAIESRMIKLGYSEEDIKAIVYPRKVSMGAKVVSHIEANMGVVDSAWWHICIDKNGVLRAEMLPASETPRREPSTGYPVKVG